MSQNHCGNQKTVRINRKLSLSILAFLFVLGLSYLPALTPLNHSLLSYLSLIWWAVLLGLFAGGLIDYFIPEETIGRFLGGKSHRSIVYAVFAGFLMSACSHGILAIAIQLHKKGASGAATISFLLASPWANLPVTFLLFGLFGWKAALFVGAAMLIAIVTGFIYLSLERHQLIEASPELVLTDRVDWENLKNFNLKRSVAGVYTGMLQLANMVMWWIIIGIVFSALIGAYVPQHIFTDFFGPSLSGLGLTLVAATVIEVCSEGSAPVAFELYDNVGVLGNPFVFLMAGVVTDYTEIGLLWANIGKRTALWLPVVTLPQVLLAGYLFNLL